MAESSSPVSASVIGGTHPNVMAMVEDACRATQQPKIDADNRECDADTSKLTQAKKAPWADPVS